MNDGFCGHPNNANGRQLGSGYKCYLKGRKAGFVGGLNQGRSKGLQEGEAIGVRRGKVLGSIEGFKQGTTSRENKFMGKTIAQLKAIPLNTLNIDTLRALVVYMNERIPVGNRLPGASRANGPTIMAFLQTQGFIL